jgi:hypothetical protein
MKGPHDFCATSRVLHRRHRRERQAARDPSRGDRRERSRHALRGAPSSAPCVIRFPAYASTREDAEVDGSASGLRAPEKSGFGMGVILAKWIAASQHSLRRAWARDIPDLPSLPRLCEGLLLTLRSRFSPTLGDGDALHLLLQFFRSTSCGEICPGTGQRRGGRQKSWRLGVAS